MITHLPKNLVPRLLAGLLVLSSSIHAQETNEVETKLREALRDSMLKLRDAQGQIATAQAAQIAAENEITTLKAKNESLAKELSSERNVSANMIAELTTKLEERATVITQLQTSIEKWKKSYAGATTLAAKKESERAKFEARAIQLERIVNDQKMKNIQMYQAGMETLDRYEKFGLGDALLAREPFVSTTRIKFQNAIQDQADKLVDARIRPPEIPGSAPSANAAPAGAAPANAAPQSGQNPDSDAKPATPSKPKA